MKDAFNEDLPYITHFVAIHPFLRRPYILLTFIRHLIYINLIKQKKKKKKPSLSNIVQTILILQIAVCIHILCPFFIVIILNIFVCS